MRYVLAVLVCFVASEAFAQYGLPTYNYRPTYAQRNRAARAAQINQQERANAWDAKVAADNQMKATNPNGWQIQQMQRQMQDMQDTQYRQMQWNNIYGRRVEITPNGGNSYNVRPQWPY